MPKKSTTAEEGAPWRDWLRLQEQLIERAAEYVEGLSQLVGEGSVEPREYFKRSTDLWADLVGEVGDWIRPQGNATRGVPELPRIARQVGRRTISQPIPLPIPSGLFDGAARDSTFHFSIDGLRRRTKTLSSLRPTMVMEPDRHFRLRPEEVKRSDRREVELKIFDLPDNLVSGDVYEGVLWAAPVTQEPRADAKSAKKKSRAEGAGAPPKKLGTRKPIAIVEIKIL